MLEKTYIFPLVVVRNIHTISENKIKDETRANKHEADEDSRQIFHQFIEIHQTAGY
jgi:hypothetical protein